MSSVKSQRASFQQIDQELQAYYHRFGSVRSNVEEKIEDEDGIFIHCMNHNAFDEDDIDTELGTDCKPNECAYVWALNESISPLAFPIPPYLHVPNETKDDFLFYILQWMYVHNACPSDAEIKDSIMHLVSGKLVRDDNSDAYYECIDNSIDTEAKKWADNLSSERYLACR
eukprot:273507_1